MSWVTFTIVISSLVLGKFINSLVPEEKTLRNKLAPMLLFLISLMILIYQTIINYSIVTITLILIGLILGNNLSKDHIFIAIVALSSNLITSSFALIYCITRGLKSWKELWVIIFVPLVFIPKFNIIIISIASGSLILTNFKELFKP